MGILIGRPFTIAAIAERHEVPLRKPAVIYVGNDAQVLKETFDAIGNLGPSGVSTDLHGPRIILLRIAVTTSLFKTPPCIVTNESQMPVSPHLVLTLTPDNPSNTTITDAETGKVVYRVITTFEPKTITKLENANEDVIASWQWRDSRSDVLTLGNNPPISSSSWLKKSMVPLKDTVTFIGPADKTYQWKGNSPGSSLELFSQDDNKSAIARFQKSHRRSGLPAQLTIASSATSSTGSSESALQELIVISFLMLERKRRIGEISTGNMAITLAQPMGGVSIL